MSDGPTERAYRSRVPVDFDLDCGGAESIEALCEGDAAASYNIAGSIDTRCCCIGVPAKLRGGRV